MDMKFYWAGSILLLLILYLLSYKNKPLLGKWGPFLFVLLGMLTGLIGESGCFLYIDTAKGWITKGMDNYDNRVFE